MRLNFAKINTVSIVHCRSLLRDERSENRLRNVKYSGCCILLLCRYAGDLVVFLQSHESLLQTVELLDQIFKEFGVSINNSKIEIRTNEDIESIISLRGKNLNNKVNVFKYLRAFINSNQPNTGEVR